MGPHSQGGRLEDRRLRAMPGVARRQDACRVERECLLAQFGKVGEGSAEVGQEKRKSEQASDGSWVWKITIEDQTKRRVGP